MKDVLPKLVWVLVAVVLALGVYRLATTKDHRSADQKILIEKAK